MSRAVLCLFMLLAGCAAFTPEHYTVFFQPKSAALDAPAKQVIATLALKASQRPGAVVTLSGYTAPGPVQENKKLAAARVGAVADAFAADGLDPARIRRQPMGGVDFALDSIESRRVEITLGLP